MCILYLHGDGFSLIVMASKEGRKILKNPQTTLIQSLLQTENHTHFQSIGLFKFHLYLSYMLWNLFHVQQVVYEAMCCSDLDYFISRFPIVFVLRFTAERQIWQKKCEQIFLGGLRITKDRLAVTRSLLLHPHDWFNKNIII